MKMKSKDLNKQLLEGIAKDSFETYYNYYHQGNYKWEDMSCEYKRKMIVMVEDRLSGGDGDERFNGSVDAYIL